MSTSKTNNKKPAGWIIALVGYLFLVGCLIGMSMNSDAKTSFGRFHLRQAFAFHILFHSVGAFLYLTKYQGDRTLLWIIYFGLLLFGLLSVFRQKKTTLPFLKEHPQNWFTFIP